MMLPQNAALIRQRFPDIYIKLQGDRNGGVLPEVIPSKKSEPTLTVTVDGKAEYLHSQYDPIHEANRFVQQLPDLSSYNHVLFFGAGLGYHITAFRTAYPNMPYSLYEMQPELLSSLLSHYDLANDRNLKGIYVGSKPQEFPVLLQHFVRQTNGSFYVAVLPGYKRVFQEQVDQFLSSLQKAVEDSRRLLGVRNAFEKKWMINAMANLKYTLHTKNLFAIEENVFYKKPVILIAAGPSLSQEIENLRRIKEEGSAYLIAVGSAVNSLLHHGIHPDAACTYDPHFHNINVVKKVIDERAEIPLIYGTTVGYTTLPNYPGPMFHVITKTDPVADYFLQFENQGKPLKTVNDAPSIAVIALQLFAQLGADPIVFVGQNLAFLKDQYYASGIVYDGRPTEVSAEDQEEALYTEDVYGNEVQTNWPFYMMKTQLEHYIEAYTGRTYFNTTNGGAKIEGAPFVELSQLIRERFAGQRVVDDWVNASFASYDPLRISKLNEQLLKQSESYDKVVEELQRLFKQLDSSVRNRNERQAQKTIMKFGASFGKFQSNVFYNVIVKPMNSIQLEILTNEMDKINNEPRPMQRAQLILEYVGKYVYECSVSIENLRPLFDKMGQDIQEYLAANGVSEVES